MSAMLSYAAAVEHRRGHHQNRAVEEEREHQRDRRVDRRIADRLAAAGEVVAVFPRLHDRRVQIEVVRHHRRAEDADRDVEHVVIAHDLGRRQQPAGDLAPGRRATAITRPRSSRRCRRSAARPAPRRSGSGGAAARARAARRPRSGRRPTTAGCWNSRLSAIAAPITSARSQAAIAISHSSHSTMVVGRE